MTARDPHLRLPSWLIAASLAVLVVATLTYFITSSNDNTDEAAPPPDSSTSASDEPKKPKKTERSGGPKKAKKAKGSDREADKPAKKKQAEKKRAAPQPKPNATVDVYNNSGITNLAASVSSDVRTAGFAIGGVDNWYGSIPESTVYYPGGMEEQAKLLASELGLSRTMPALHPMSTDRLSLILTAAI